MNIEEMKKSKIEHGFTNADLSEASGVPLSTVNKIFSGQTKAPRKESLRRLEAVLGRHEETHYADTALFRESASYYAGNSVDPKNMEVAEGNVFPYGRGTAAVKKRQGEFDIHDYLSLPDDVRAELIDGTLYAMASPGGVHQMIAGHVSYQLMNHILENNGVCKPISAPFDVYLDKDEKTCVQPDLLILCHPEQQIRDRKGYGAPDFIMEILSESTRKRDMTIKLSKYSAAGVREYWIVDPDNLQILAYDLEHEAFPRLYRFTDRVPVMIWNGDFEVDFGKVYEYVKDYLEESL